MRKGTLARPTFAAVVVLTAAMVVAAAQSPPRDQISKLRFSPDGRYVLAQERSQISVLTAAPLAVLFRIPADDARDVQFTPDSQHIAFLIGGTRVNPIEIKFAKSPSRVEYWSVVDRARIDTHDLPNHICAAERLSPDGRVLTCMDLFGTLWLIDINSGGTLLREDGFGSPGPDWNGAAIEDETPDPGYGPAKPESVAITFSPDARYVVAAWQEHHAGSGGNMDLTRMEWWSGKAIVWDLRLKQPVRLNDHLKILADTAATHARYRDRRRSFAFVGPDRLLVSDPMRAKKGYLAAELLEFPSGVTVSKLVVPVGTLLPATDPNFVIVRLAARRSIGHPIHAAAVELNTGKLTVSNTPALDVLGRYSVAESSPGRVGLYEGKNLRTTIDLHKD